jgi:hypothetical protein
MPDPASPNGSRTGLGFVLSKLSSSFSINSLDWVSNPLPGREQCGRFPNQPPQGNPMPDFFMSVRKVNPGRYPQFGNETGNHRHVTN